MGEGISTNIIDAWNVVKLDLRVVLHDQHGKGPDEYHQVYTVGRALGTFYVPLMICCSEAGCTWIICKTSQCKNHGACIGPLPFDTYLLVMKIHQYECAGKKQHAKIKVTGIGEQLVVRGYQPLGLIEKVDAIPDRKVGKPPGHIMVKLFVECYPMMPFWRYQSSYEGIHSRGSRPDP